MKAPRDRSGRESEPGALLEVAVALPVADVFTYRDLPREGRLPLGSQVVVPFRGRKVTGFVVGHPEAIPPDAPEKIRPILAVVGDSPVLDQAVLDLCRWAASYYLAPLGEVLCAALPSGERASSSRRLRLTAAGQAAADGSANAGLAAMALDTADRALLARIKQARTLSQTHVARSSSAGMDRVTFLIERGFVEVADTLRGAGRRRRDLGTADSEGAPPPSEVPPTLNAHQEAAFSALLGALDRGYATFLLQGITGSGKTEIYLRIIAEARQRGRGALVTMSPSCTAPCRPASAPPPGAGCGGARWASRWGRVPRCSPRFAIWRSWWWTRSTTARSSKRTDFATTPATSLSCAPARPLRSPCLARRRRASKATTMSSSAASGDCCCPCARTRRLIHLAEHQHRFRKHGVAV